ncbi:MAG: prolyl oligopeptidase family serine peptidase [Candidatus Izemoplasmatales bacterium]
MKGAILKCRLIVEAFDFGPAISSIVFSFPAPLNDSGLMRDTFTIIIKKKNTPYLVEIASAGINDNELLLKLICHPDNYHLSPLTYDYLTHHDRFAEKIDLLVHTNKPFVLGDFVYEDTVEILESILEMPDLDGFSYDKYRHNSKILLAYGLFSPGDLTSKRPLVIWLHGAKEGGDDPRVAILGNPISYLKRDEIQNRFGGFFILIPQAGTMWMDEGNGHYTDSGRSLYSKPLIGLINSILDNYPAIDRERVYIGGCSNGGFMAIRLIADHPELFAAAFPTSEACFDRWLTDKDIQNIKTVPTWFFACSADTVVPSDLCTVMTFERLVQAGASDVHLSLVDEIRDRHGAFFESDGTPYLYDGHWAWLEPLNDAKDSDGRSFFDWLFSHTKH